MSAAVAASLSAGSGQEAIRAWLRLLSCATTIEKRLRRRIVDRYGTTLPRFDVLAALARASGGLTMTDLSRSLLVSAGNVTPIVQLLAREGLVITGPMTSDRRSSVVRLTAAGRARFNELADAHQGWVNGMFAKLPPAHLERLTELLDELRGSVAAEGNCA